MSDKSISQRRIPQGLHPSLTNSPWILETPELDGLNVVDEIREALGDRLDAVIRVRVLALPTATTTAAAAAALVNEKGVGSLIVIDVFLGTLKVAADVAVTVRAAMDLLGLDQDLSSQIIRGGKSLSLSVVKSTYSQPSIVQPVFAFK